MLLGTLVILVIVGCGGGGTSSTVARRHAPPARPCEPEQLVVSHEGGANGTMSTDRARFIVVNLSERACSISGFPKLFALRPGGRAIEGPAGHGTGTDGASAGPLNIAGRGSATFKVSWSADVYPRGRCGPRIVVGYRVVLPGSRLAQTVPYPNFEHCTGPAAKGSLAVGRLEPALEATRHLVPPTLEGAKPAERLPRCAPSDLVVWQGIDYPGGAAAGTAYGHLEVTNLAERACELSGVPHMVAVDLHGRPIDPPIRRL